MRPPRHMALVNKSVDACLAAIEIYNKPDFRYREEAFSILMLNAWELLLKARVMKESGGKLRGIEVWESRPRLDGTKTKREYPKLNRAGNRMTISLAKASELVRSYKKNGIDDRCMKNLVLLTEIRDNSVHLLNVNPGLSQRIQEVGSAALKNFANAAEDWFDVDLSKFNFYLMPLAFHSPTAVIESLHSEKHPAAVKNLLDHIAEAQRDNPSDEQQLFNVTMRVELRFVRTTSENALLVQVTREPDAPKVQLTEENIRETFPWNFGELTKQLKKRYSDFVINSKFYKIKRSLEDNKSLCCIRYLDPERPKGAQKKFYNPNILAAFDEYYTPVSVKACR